jgi:hypothetical protein
MTIPRTHHRRRAFSLMEVLILVVVLGIVAAAAGRALQAVARTPVTTDEIFQLETQMISKMEELRAQPFDTLIVGPGTVSTVTVGNAPGTVKTYQMTVEIALADADGNGLPEANFKQVKVSLAGQSITTLVTK